MDREAELSAQLAREGLRPTRWSNGPDAVYGVHEHRYGKVLVVAAGSIIFTLEDGKRTVEMLPPPAASAKGGPVWRSGRVYRVVAPDQVAGGDLRQVVGIRPGDRLEVPPNTPHSAIVGAEGVVCLEAHIRPKRRPA
jgi:quercetin dioxygenase-like cupin family protein